MAETESRASAAPPVALKETCRVVCGTIPLWRWHRARLAGGGVGDSVLAEAEAAALAAAAEWAGAATRRARLSVVVSAQGDVSAEVSQRLSSLDVPHGPVAVRVDVEELPPLPEHPAKPADRTYWDAAQRQAEFLGAHQGVLVGPDGLVLDGSTSTIWIAEEGALVTPPTPWAIPGVARAFMLERARISGLAICIETIAWERFDTAEEAFLTNAFGGAVAIRGRGGFVFETARALFDEVWRAGFGSDPNAGW